MFIHFKKKKKLQEPIQQEDEPFNTEKENYKVTEQHKVNQNAMDPQILPKSKLFVQRYLQSMSAVPNGVDPYKFLF